MKKILMVLSIVTISRTIAEDLRQKTNHQSFNQMIEVCYQKKDQTILKEIGEFLRDTSSSNLQRLRQKHYTGKNKELRGCTMLHAAVMARKHRVIEMLLYLGWDRNRTVRYCHSSYNRYTALDIAAQSGDYGAMELLIRWGATLSNRAVPELQRYLVHFSPSFMYQLIIGKLVDVCAGHGNTVPPIFELAQNFNTIDNALIKLQLLLTCGVSLNHNGMGICQLLTQEPKSNLRQRLITAIMDHNALLCQGTTNFLC